MRGDDRIYQAAGKAQWRINWNTGVDKMIDRQSALGLIVRIAYLVFYPEDILAKSG